MKKLLLLFSFIGLSHFSFAQLNEVWSYRDSIQGLGRFPLNEMLIDSAANTYITGYHTNGDAFLKKVDKDGNLVWIKLIVDSVQAVSLRPRKLFFNSSGNIILVVAATYHYRTMVMEYSDAGNLLNSKICRYGNHMLDAAVMDSADKIYLGMGNKGVSTHFGDYIYHDVQVVDASGDSINNFNMNQPAVSDGFDHNEVSAIDMAKDTGVFVLTSARATNNYYEVSLYKIDTLGFTLRQTDLGSLAPNNFSGACTMETDPYGDVVFVEKGSDIPFPITNSFISKISAIGLAQWTLSTPSFFYSDMTLDSIGNIYLTGQQYGYLIVRKINPSGQLMWTYNYAPINHTFENGLNILLGNNGDVFVLGNQSDSLMPSNYRRFESAIVIHLGSGGNYIDSNTKNFVPKGWSINGLSFALDASDNVYVSGAGAYKGSYLFEYKLCNNLCNGNITGIRYTDANSNCTYDTSELKLSGHLILLEPDNIYATTDVNGFYSFSRDSGDYVLKPVFNPYWIPTCNKDSVQVSINLFNPSDTVDFGSLGSGPTFPPSIRDLQISYGMSSLVRPGFTQYQSISYSNVGTDTIDNCFIRLDLAPIFNLVNSSPPPDSVSGNSYFWNLGTLTCYEGGSIQIQTTVPPGTALNTFFQNVACIFPYLNDTSAYNNCDTIRGRVTGSCDPNQKLVSTTQFNVADPLLPADNEIAYHIDFQNTGNDTAFLVKILDTLSTSLDIATIRFGASSHPYTWEIYGPGILKFTFNNILLADSNINEAQSHGFVNYYIRTKPNLAVNTNIANTANIYFDFNENVRTNTAYYPPPISTAIHSTNPKVVAKIYPNPFRDEVTVSLGAEKKMQIEIYDVNGRKVFGNTLNNPALINTGSLKSGIYFLHTQTETQSNYSKIVKY